MHSNASATFKPGAQLRAPTQNQFTTHLQPSQRNQLNHSVDFSQISIIYPIFVPYIYQRSYPDGCKKKMDGWSIPDIYQRSVYHPFCFYCCSSSFHQRFSLPPRHGGSCGLRRGPAVVASGVECGRWGRSVVKWWGEWRQRVRKLHHILRNSYGGFP